VTAKKLISIPGSLLPNTGKQRKKIFYHSHF